ncbi:MAG: VOC family protein [Arenicellales bacterium WSBS_2016_MAG_OTU3]
MMKRTKTPWMSGADYGRSLSGFVLNMLVSNVEESVKFQQTILQAEVVYDDEDFAVLTGYGTQWMLHADHTYSHHPLSGVVANLEGRGRGRISFNRMRNPDAEQRARDNEFTVMQGMDKPHGLRECFLLDSDGYCWVPSVPIENA